MVKIQEYIDIKKYSTLNLGGQFRYFVVISSVSELTSIYAIVHDDVKYKNIPIFVLGGGSNVVFSDGVLNMISVKIEIKGFDVVNDTSEYIDIKVGAGENWDKIVEKTVLMNLSGLESLSAIPGTVGASPVQNIGAYGSEVKDTILEVEVYEIKTGKIIKLSNEDCKFGYRDSIFKGDAKGKYIITAVIFRLVKNTENNSKALSYPGVSTYFENKKIPNPTLKQIREAVIYIRSEKLPNPSEVPNVGSFFKNPIVTNDIASRIKEEFPNAKFFPIDDNLTKVPAGFLIENAGLKGLSFGKVSVYGKNALVLINNSDANCEDVIFARNKIIEKVFDKFGITLEQEPEIV